MSDRIEKAQDIVADELAAMLQADENAWITDNACVIVDALGKAGLLTPDLREEWGEGPIEDGEPSHWPVPVDGCVACDSARPTYRRYVTDWEEA